jgi:hypothetical protein
METHASPGTMIRSRLRPMNPNPCPIAPRFAGSEASAPYRGLDGGRVDPSRTNDERALEPAHTEPERRFRKRRLANASARPPPLLQRLFRASVRGADDTKQRREQRIENGEVTMLKKVVYVALLVSDQDKALDYYTKVIGLEKRGDYPHRDTPRFLTVGVKGQDFQLAAEAPQ